MASPFFFVVENGRKSEFFTNAGVIPHPLSAIDKVTHPFLCLVSTIIRPAPPTASRAFKSKLVIILRSCSRSPTILGSGSSFVTNSASPAQSRLLRLSVTSRLRSSSLGLRWSSWRKALRLLLRSLIRSPVPPILRNASFRKPGSSKGVGRFCHLRLNLAPHFFSSLLKTAAL